MAGEVRRRLDEILDATLAAFPSQGRDLGLHAYDGQVDDLSPAALAGRADERRRHLAELAAMAAGDDQEADDRDHLALYLAEEELMLARREEARRDPMWANRVLRVNSYLEGPAATEAERADALRRHLEQVPDALDGLAAGLDEVPLAFREAAADVLAGYASFYRTEAAGQAGREVAERAAAAVERYAARVGALDGPPLEPWGAADFGELLRVRTGVSLDAAALLARGRAEADRQLARQREAAGRAGGTVAELRAKVGPAAGELLPLAKGLVAECRRFVADSGFVSLPGDEPPGVELAPPFLRGATAFYHSPGPFEPADPAAFRRYHLTPPLPEWDVARTARWLALFQPQTLAICTLHETYPGHHAHELHLRLAPSRIATALWNEVLGEGWAHYCEEAAFEAGFRVGDPDAEVAMRTDALVRAARLLCAVGMHTQGMSLDEATREFEETAGLDPDHARLEAVRGTWDPGYFGYTLGKLEILDLRERVGGDAAAFHDRLLALGTPPPAIAARRLLP
ncbi:MAG TPA: DUF885 family protein [Actinomycetota bacterium]|nr:DUF885 family protein [Actinomycetota bacterium]